METDEPDVKRRKSFSKREIVQKLEEFGNNVQRAANEIVSDLTPFDVTDPNLEDHEEKLEKIESVAKSLAAKMYKLRNDLKSRKYRRNPDLLDEKVISCSQHSVLQSEDDALSECLSQQSLQDVPENRPTTYRFFDFDRPVLFVLIFVSIFTKLGNSLLTLQWIHEVGGDEYQ